MLSWNEFRVKHAERGWSMTRMSVEYNKYKKRTGAAGAAPHAPAGTKDTPASLRKRSKLELAAELTKLRQDIQRMGAQPASAPAFAYNPVAALQTAQALEALPPTGWPFAGANDQLLLAAQAAALNNLPPFFAGVPGLTANVPPPPPVKHANSYKEPASPAEVNPYKFEGIDYRELENPDYLVI
jgi:hypothetical protein